MMTQNQRNNKVTALILLIPIGIAVIFLLLVPAFWTLQLSMMKEYNPMKGMAGGTWVGFANYAKFFSIPQFLPLMRNNLLLSFLGIIVPAIPAFFIAFFMVKIPLKWRGYLTGALLLPVLLPELVYVSFALNVLPNSLFTEPQLFPLLYLLVTGIPTMFFYGFLGALFGQQCVKSGKSPVAGATAGLAVALFCGCGKFLTLNFETVSLLQNPLNMQSSDILDTYIYRTSMLQMLPAPAAAAWVTKILIQIPIAVILAFVLVIMLKPSTGIVNRKHNQAASPLALLFPAIGALVAILISVIPPRAAEGVPQNAGASMMQQSVGSSIFMVLLTSVAFLLFMVLAGYACYRLGSGMTMALCIILMLFSGNNIGEYFFFRSLGMVNTNIPVFLTNIMSGELLLVVVLFTSLSIGNRQAGISAWLGKAAPLLLLLVGINATNVWGSWRASLLFVGDQSKFGLPMLFRQGMVSGNSLSPVYLVLGLGALLIGVLAIAVYGFLKNRQKD